MRDRLAAETPDERETRLHRMSTNQRERLAVEAPEERETRLQQMRDRLAAETPEEREMHCTSRVECKNNISSYVASTKNVP